MRSIKNNSSLLKETNKFYKKRENFRKLALDSLHTTRSQQDKFDRIHHQEKGNNDFFHKKRNSIGNPILPLKYFSDKIKNSTFQKKI